MKYLVHILILLSFAACTSSKPSSTAKTDTSDGSDNYHETLANDMVNYTTRTKAKRERKAEKRRKKINKQDEKVAKKRKKELAKKKNTLKPPTL